MALPYSFYPVPVPVPVPVRFTALPVSGLAQPRGAVGSTAWELNVALGRGLFAGTILKFTIGKGF